MTKRIRCLASDTDGYPGVYCRECIESVAWVLKRARDDEE